MLRIGVIALMAALSMGAASAPERGDAPPVRPDSAQEVEVMAVHVDTRTQHPTILLQGKRDRRTFAMTIGLAEATGIAVPLQGLTPPRPLTHDLFMTLFSQLKVNVSRVVITDLRDDIYYATIHLTGSAGELALDARPSDAIALAVRARAPVMVEDRVFEKSAAPAPARRPSI
jgi:bifunctional DNase/RNase